VGFLKLLLIFRTCAHWSLHLSARVLRAEMRRMLLIVCRLNACRHGSRSVFLSRRFSLHFS
jgi:hypothetical protein